jgi:hypothetical protein
MFQTRVIQVSHDISFSIYSRINYNFEFNVFIFHAPISPLAYTNKIQRKIFDVYGVVTDKMKVYVYSENLVIYFLLPVSIQ